MKYIKGRIEGNHLNNNYIELLNLLGVDVDLTEDLEPLEEEPHIIHEPCEDYPCCGHDICPPRWSTGEQAAMVCTCGKLLPPNNRFVKIMAWIDIFKD